MNVVIVDYGMGNIKSIIGALKYLGISEINLSNEYETMKAADKLILPGVGSFAQAMQVIKEMRLDVYLNEIVLEKKKPILGICLGMQLMGMSSTENGNNAGLGFVDGLVTRFDDQHLKVPHVGFNQVAVNTNLKLYRGMTGKIDFYFTHSYKMTCEQSINSCYCEYGENFIASYEMNHIAGVQFHPELSQSHGLRLIKNFIEQF